MQAKIKTPACIKHNKLSVTTVDLQNTKQCEKISDNQVCRFGLIQGSKPSETNAAINRVDFSLLEVTNHRALLTVYKYKIKLT